MPHDALRVLQRARHALALAPSNQHLGHGREGLGHKRRQPEHLRQDLVRRRCHRAQSHRQRGREDPRQHHRHVAHQEMPRAHQEWSHLLNGWDGDVVEDSELGMLYSEQVHIQARPEPLRRGGGHPRALDAHAPCKHEQRVEGDVGHSHHQRHRHRHAQLAQATERTLPDGEHHDCGHAPRPPQAVLSRRRHQRVTAPHHSQDGRTAQRKRRRHRRPGQAGKHEGVQHHRSRALWFVPHQRRRHEVGGGRG
mmetsp:Transcript_26432/g.50197  ORF Transcript_26432/g.50197 Transcript_26432/m.50197 type:complete len:251 (-) Transcript_26432:609-1361(-)